MESLISQIAPHRCIVCSKVGVFLCEPCSLEVFIRPPSRCYSCHQASVQSQVCANCRRRAGLSHVWVATEYEDTAKKLIHKLKFARANAAADILAKYIDDELPDLPNSIIVTNVPTANTRVRVRGYDQSKLIAKCLAKRRGWQYVEVLERLGSSRQVGSSRKKRLSQLESAFRPTKSVKGAHILLIDDVVTTGATLGAASKTLKAAGAKIVDAAVFTQPVDD